MYNYTWEVEAEKLVGVGTMRSWSKPGLRTFKVRAWDISFYSGTQVVVLVNALTGIHTLSRSLDLCVQVEIRVSRRAILSLS